ncbi:MAG: capsid cement protein [Pontibacterium sp.]
MKNFRTEYDGVLNLVAPAEGVLSGVPVAIGGLLVVPHADAVAGQAFSARCTGVFEMAKASADAPAQLDKAYWDDANSVVTTSADDGADPAVLHSLVGVFYAPAVGGLLVADVLLTGELI